MDSSSVSSAPSSPSSVDGSTANSAVLKEHPLLNPLIVEKIVKQLDPTFEQMKTLRLVCKVWTSATLHHWRNSCAVLTLLPNPDVARWVPPSTIRPPKGVSLSKFFTEFQDPETPFQLSEKPFAKYKFKEVIFHIQVSSETGEPAQTFWNSIGPLVKSLHFENCIFLKPFYGGICPLVQFLVTVMPNVEHLVLDDVVYHRLSKGFRTNSHFQRRAHLNLRTVTLAGDFRDTEARTSVSLEDLFEWAANLESIKKVDSVSPYSFDTDKGAVMEAMRNVRFERQLQEDPLAPVPFLSKLKHLDLINSTTILGSVFPWNSFIPPPAQENEEDEGILEQLPLETLSLQLEVTHWEIDNEEAEPAEDLNKYLWSFCGTLKRLELYRAPVGPPPYSNFMGGPAAAGGTEMTLLREVHLWGAVAEDFAFLKGTPNLKRLVINLGCFEKREDYRETNYLKYAGDMVAKVATNLKGCILCSELEHLEIDYEFPGESLRILGEWMPNLKRLKSILNGGTIPVVCEIWGEGLSELVCLHGSRVDNSCVIREEGSFEGWPGSKLKICDLKGLERFQLETYCGKSKLTGEAVFQGFLKMRGLKSVQICVDGGKMSEEAVEALRRGIQFCEVTWNGGGGYGICRCDRCTFRREVGGGGGQGETDEEVDEYSDGSAEN